MQIVVNPDNKGKGRASSTDLVSPREKRTQFQIGDRLCGANSVKRNPYAWDMG
jgi:hypothetical protein